LGDLLVGFFHQRRLGVVFLNPIKVLILAVVLSRRSGQLAMEALDLGSMPNGILIKIQTHRSETAT
jgi:hypothetical protein